MKMPRKFSRRKFIATALVAAPALVVSDGRLVEPNWLKIRHLRIGTGKPTHRFVQFSDIHHKGDRQYLESVVKEINALSPEFVCFTGDILEDAKYLTEALEIMGGIKSPLYGVPGNHDFWAFISFKTIKEQFVATGGDWLLEQHVEIGDDLNLIGLMCIRSFPSKLPLNPNRKNIVLMHYPAWVNFLGNQKCDLLLAGHSHGGQVRIPFYGPLTVPNLVEQYDMGLFQTKAGPLYVNPGIGYIGKFNFRFNCRPEITVIEV
jgi:predicted MPP superfamily phosphohydrolase